MVRADPSGSGVMFSIDTGTGFPRAALINAGWGLGETVVQGIVDPDESMVFKPLLEIGDGRPVIGKALGRKGREMVYARDGDTPTRLVDTSEPERNTYVLDDDFVDTLAYGIARLAATFHPEPVIGAAHQSGRKIGLCGQAPSDHPDFARLLVDAVIDSIPVNPDSFIAVREHVAAAEAASGRGRG